jgi:NAD(P)-dependent dehydrogenase (short-subunit alcohol dehydrogenase family)
MDRILITGASRGIGRAIAVKLASEGRTLLIHGRHRNTLEDTATQVRARGAVPEIVVCDLSRPEDVEAMVAHLKSKPLSVLVNNAGIAIVKPFAAHSLAEWQETLAINVTAPFLLIKGLAPLMPRGGSIVNIISIAAKTVFPDWSSYCMSKFALDGFARTVREELRSEGIRVINIYPASTATDIWTGIPGEWPREQMMLPESVADAVAMALAQPHGVLVDDISLGPLGGTL